MRNIREFLLIKESINNDIINETYDILIKLFDGASFINICKLCDLLKIKYNESDVEVEVDDNNIKEKAKECIDWLEYALTGMPIQMLVDMDQLDEEALDKFDDFVNGQEFKQASKEFLNYLHSGKR